MTLRVLTLMRHAKAEPATAGDDDWDRELKKSGERDAKEMAQRLKARELDTPLILTSPAVRARRTAHIAADVLGIKHKHIIEDDRLYLGSPTDLLKVIREHGGETKHVMLFGHNPGITDLANQLSDERRIDNMPTAAFVTATFPLNHWSELQKHSAEDVEFEWPAKY